MSEQHDEFHTPEPPIVDAEEVVEDAKAEEVPPAAEKHDDFDQLAEGLKKAATETAYATVGLVDLVSSRAREFYAEQKKQYTSAHPDEDEQTTTGFMTQLGSQLDKLIGDITSGFRDLADRGRSAGRDATLTPEVTDHEEAPASPAEEETPSTPADDAADDGPSY